MQVITITRENTFRGHGSLRPFYWVYRAIGPDGRRFDNASRVTMESVIKRRYGRDVRFVRAWEAV